MESLGNEGQGPVPPSAWRDCGNILQCPLTGGCLVPAEKEWIGAGEQRYPVSHRIPDLSAPIDAAISTREVSQTAETLCARPLLADYDGLASRESLVASSRRSQFAAALDDQLPARCVVLDAGCGTGRLTNFLGLAWNRRVFGGDGCASSLQMANAFRERHRIVNAAFMQMNPLRPPFHDESIDVVIANNALHSVADPRRGFEALLRKVKPGGFILLRLFSRYSWSPDPRRRSPFRDFHRRYRPHRRTRHSIDEVLGWFDASGVEFVSSIPAADGAPFTAHTRIFEPNSRGNATLRTAAQLNLCLTGGGDGGLFVMTGRKRR